MRFACFLLILTVAVPGAWSAESTGPVTIGGVRYDSVDPGEPFKERERPPVTWRAPAPARAERSAGMMAYVTPDPGDYRPDVPPRPEERVRQLSTFLAQGEEEPVVFGIHSLRDLRGLSVTVDPGKAPVTVDVRHMHFWPQRTGWRSREYYITPELLLPCRDGKKMVPLSRGVLEERPFDLRAGENTAFWITLRCPDNAQAGTYRASVTVRSEEGQLVLPLQIEVLPFRLQRPTDRYWLLYADVMRWRTMSDAQILAELRDFARHGFNGLVEMPLGSADLSEIRSGKVRFDASAYLRLATLCKEAGLPGPHVCSFGGMPAAVRDALGLKCDLEKDVWPEALKEGVAAVARAAVEATRDAPAAWHFYGVDEPGADNTYAVQEYECWRRGGALTYATSGDLRFFERAAADYLTAPCFISGLVSSAASARIAREGSARRKAEFWWYGTGCYVNPFPQEGTLFANRYGAGFFLWKSGAKAAVAWTFCRVHQDVFNDFDGSAVNPAEPKEQATAYPHLLKADDWSTYQGAIPTIAWEAHREGVDDYAYLHVATQLIEQARRSDQQSVRQAAEAAQRNLDALVEAIPWTNLMNAPTFETPRLHKVRHAVARLIVDLQDLLAGRRVSRKGSVPITLVVRAEEPTGVEAAPLPVLPIVRTAQAPLIDGDCTDACWRDSAVAGDFRTVPDGEPASAPTEARALCDDEALYVSFVCHEPRMDQLVARQEGHDTPMVWIDDSIELFVASADRTKYAHFIVNPNTCVYDEKNQDPSWDPAVQVRVRKESDRWCVEMAIPWAELATAGVTRAPVLAANFCRSRFAGGANRPHAAWSVTDQGFHVPERFGVALLQEGPVALTEVRLPNRWGNQKVEVGLRNRTDAPTTAVVGIRGGATQRVDLPAGATKRVAVPLELRQAGKANPTLTWGVQGQALAELPLSLQVPEPVGLADGAFLATSGEVLTLPVRLGVAGAEGTRSRVRVAVGDSQRPVTLELPARPGASASVRLRLHGAAPVRISLVDGTGRSLAPAVRSTLLPLP